MQAFYSSNSWVQPGGTLGELVAASRQRAQASALSRREILAAAADVRPAHAFASCLRGPHVRVIAEIKRASPSRGAIAPALDAASQAAAYQEGGAAAISVLTEPARFGGSLSDLAAASSAVAIPTIRKDFIVDAIQVWEARAAGASAVLLIVRALFQDDLVRLLEEVNEAGMEALVEVRDEAELTRALEAGAKVIGVNNRNLETLEIDSRTAPSLIPTIPADLIAVAESGMRTPADVHPAALAGADAILVGTAISGSSNVGEMLMDLSSIKRVRR